MLASRIPGPNVPGREAATRVFHARRRRHAANGPQRMLWSGAPLLAAVALVLALIAPVSAAAGPTRLSDAAAAASSGS